MNPEMEITMEEAIPIYMQFDHLSYSNFMHFTLLFVRSKVIPQYYQVKVFFPISHTIKNLGHLVLGL